MAWVTRNKSEHYATCGHDVFITAKKPTRRRDGNFDKCKLNPPTDFYFTAKGFKAIFKFTPKKGSCKQMNLSLTEI